MYCSSCGMAVTPSLSYCNRCGAELKAKQHSPTSLSEVTPDGLVTAITAVTVVGMGIVIGLMAVMKEVLHFNEALIIAFSLLCMFIFIGVDLVFISMLLRSKRGSKESDGINLNRELTTKGFGQAKGQALSEMAMSVTEHTTRTLESADRQNKVE